MGQRENLETIELLKGLIAKIELGEYQARAFRMEQEPEEIPTDDGVRRFRPGPVIGVSCEFAVQNRELVQA